MARKPEPPPRPSRVTIPERCHPLAKVVFALMKDQGVTYDELEHRSGVLRSTFKAWRTHNRPGLDTIEAALGALGWAVLPVPALDKVPPEIRAGLEALAAEWGEINPLLCQLMATVARSPIVQMNGPGVVVATIKPRVPRRRAEHPDQAQLIEVEAA